MVEQKNKQRITIGAYIKNLGWHFALYNNVPYEDDPLYCIEPCKNYAASTSGNYMDEDLGVSGSGSTRGSNVWYAMPYSYRQAIALTLLYSRQLWDSNYRVKTTAMANNPNVSTRIATQFLIYEIVTGLRDADTFNRRGSNGYTSGDVFYNAGVASVSGFAEKYNSIVSSVQNAMKIPSFTSRSSGSAPTITMSGNQLSVTDSNGVLLTWENLPITLQYRITETKAPVGYTLLKEAAFEGRQLRYLPILRRQ